jgi:hypothetical protein
MENEKGDATTDLVAPEETPKENKTKEEHISLGSESEEDSDGGETETTNSQATLKKYTRGRKSKKKEREEKTYLDVLQGSQKTLKGMINMCTTRKQVYSPKGSTTS